MLLLGTLKPRVHKITVPPSHTLTCMRTFTVPPWREKGYNAQADKSKPTCKPDPYLCALYFTILKSNDALRSRVRSAIGSELGHHDARKKSVYV